MARQVAAPLGRLIPAGNQMPGFQYEDIPELNPEVADLTKGQVSAIPRSETPPGAFKVAQNARTTTEGIGRRDGTIEYQTKPDSNPVILVTGMVSQTGNHRLIRMTGSAGHHSLEGVDFVEFTYGAGVAAILDGTIEVKPQVTQFLDDLYIVGFAKLLRIVDSTDTIEVVEDTALPGFARHIINTADRIIVANIGNEPFKVLWSANADPTDWTGASAGEENLVSGAKGVGDAINGLFQLGDTIIILRAESIWGGQRQPFQTAPFRFFSLVSQIGCDLPYTAVRVPKGIIFADRRTSSIYFYQLGNYPQKINGAIGSAPFDGVFGGHETNANTFQAAFDPTTFSYILGVVKESGSDMTEFWVYNILTGAWTFDDGPDARSLGFFNSGDGLVIDALEGTINSLVGTIDEQILFALTTRNYRGLATGEVINFDDDADTDWDGTAFKFIAQSPNLGGISKERTLIELGVEFDFERAGSLVLEHSKDGTNWRNTKTATLSGRHMTLRKLTTGQDLYWRATATSSDVTLKSWWAKLQEDEES